MGGGAAWQLALRPPPALVDRWAEFQRAPGHRAIPGARLIVYPEVGHLPQIEIPKRSAADVAAFLQALPPGPVSSGDAAAGLSR